MQSSSSKRTGRVKNLPFTQLHRWLLNQKEFLLQEEVKWPEGGSQRVCDTVVEPADTSMITSMDFVSLNQVYRFRLGGFSGITQTAGVINTFFACDPSAAGTNFPEWTTLAALFSEFRLVEYGVQFVCDWNNSNQSTVGTLAAGIPTCIIAGNLGTAVAPGSLTAVCDNADAKFVQIPRMTSNLGYTHVINGTGVGWSQVTTPTTTPYAGAPGSIQMYGTFGALSQANAIRCIIWGIYDFRSRI